MQNRIKNPKYYTLEEVAQHNSELDAWSVIDGKIFNLTPFIPMHPGGEKIVKSFGLDVSEMWRKYIFIFYSSINIQIVLKSN